MKFYWGAAASFAAFTAMGLLMSKYFHVEGAGGYFLMGALGALGISLYSIYAYFENRVTQSNMLKKAGGMAQAGGVAIPGGGGGNAGGGNAGGGAQGTEADQWIREANARLSQSRGGAGIANLPLIFVAGDRGTAKTSTILNSGLEPELLSGQIYQDNAVAPTRGANIFFARDTVFVEAGGTLMAQPGNWKALVEKLKPGRLKTGTGLAPRGVVLCFDLEAFTRQGAADAIASAARYLQERLGEISQVLGISFPVYVLFTRADRLPFFADFVRNLTMEEGGQVVGTTLPIRLSAGGVYAEEETRRLTEAFNLLFHSFCDQRLRLLPRETDYAKVPPAYEFPREFRKLRGMLTQFLVDIGKPSQLRASPFLRGFYFSGVREVQMRDIVASPPPTAPSAPAQPELSGATSMFRAGMLAERRAQQSMAQPEGTGRPVAQWLFLSHLFQDVVLADSASRATSGASVKTSLVKRILLASAAGLCLFYSAMLVMSYFGNKTLEDNAILAAKNIGAAEGNGAAIPSEDALRRLDTLRQSLALLSEYHIKGAPFSLRWGLYSGDSMLLPVRRIYYKKFAQLLFNPTQQGKILTFLQGTPATPGPTDDYGYAYDSLKAYLLTTSAWERSRDASLQSFLGSTLQDRWSAGRDAEIGKARQDLAKLQFDFYAHDLPNGNPYSATGDAGAVDHTRIYLSRFTGIERLYRGLLAEAAKQHPPTTFNQQFAGSIAVVTDSVEIAWAFTRDGWKFVQDQIKKQNFGGELWVLGNYQSQTPDKGAIESGILERYTKDYVDKWRAVLKGGHVNAYANYSDASTKLSLLTSPAAPLLALFWWVSQNTGLDAPPGISDKFKAVQAVVPPSVVPQYIVDQNKSYTAGLTSLQAEVGKAASNDPDGLRNWPNAASSATLITKQLAQTFPNDLDAHLETASLNLLLEPITNLDAIGRGEFLSGAGRFCTGFNALTSKFPFNPTATPEVTLDELSGFLQPKTGKLWTVYDATLKNAMTCQNGECTAKGTPALNPAFVRFVGDLMKFSHAIYGDAGSDPNLQYSLKPTASDQVDEYTVTVNGQSTTMKGGAQHSYTWAGP